MKLNPYIYSQRLIRKSELKTFDKINSFETMQKAAKKCFEYIIKNNESKKTLIICGPGNNGGDGILIAKHFFDRKKNVSIYAPLQTGKTEDSKKALLLLNSKKIIKEKINIDEYDLIIDCLFGVGLNRSIPDKLNNFILELNNAKAKIISIDIPSGVYTDTGQIDSIAVNADVTLTFHRLKPGLLLLPGKEHIGKIKILNIQLINLDDETKTYLLTPPKIKKNKNTDHKYLRGTSYVIAGNQLIGAAKLATLAASQSSLRSGAGVSKIFIKKSNEHFFKPHILEEMIITYENNDHLIDIIQNTKITSLIYGCGINISQNNRDLLNLLLNQKINIVLDASAFALMKKNKNSFIDKLRKRVDITILTPHTGEFKSFFDYTNNKIKDCIKASKQTNSIILYKGNDTVITSPSGKAYINYLTSPSLATAGSGDVLAGIIGGLLAQHYSGIEAVKLACYIHSQCGIQLNHGLIASDLIKKIPSVIKNLIRNN